jgi:hypothetical protein
MWIWPSKVCISSFHGVLHLGTHGPLLRRWCFCRRARHSWWQLSAVAVAFLVAARRWRPLAIRTTRERMDQLPHHAPYLGALIIVLQNGFNVWDNRWRHMDHLQFPFLTNFGYMAHQLEIALGHTRLTGIWMLRCISHRLVEKAGNQGGVENLVGRETQVFAHSRSHRISAQCCLLTCGHNVGESNFCHHTRWR